MEHDIRMHCIQSNNSKIRTGPHTNLQLCFSADFNDGLALENVVKNNVTNQVKKRLNLILLKVCQSVLVSVIFSGGLKLFLFCKI